jgi:hypothetical protein
MSRHCCSLVSITLFCYRKVSMKREADANVTPLEIISRVHTNTQVESSTWDPPFAAYVGEFLSSMDYVHLQYSIVTLDVQYVERAYYSTQYCTLHAREQLFTVCTTLETVSEKICLVSILQ